MTAAYVYIRRLSLTRRTESCEESDLKKEIAILIIEDNPDDLMLLEENVAAVEEFEAKTLHADCLHDAFVLMDNNEVDVAIIDLTLPDSEGLETFLSFHKKHPLVPSVILSGHRDHDLAYRAIKEGAQDYLFKGEPSRTVIIRTIRYAIERQRLTTELRKALEHVEELQELLPICSYCKKIRDDKGYWNRIENYFSSRLETRFSHAICPECASEHFPEYYPFKSKD